MSIKERFTALELLSKEDPAEYVRKLFETGGEWYDALFILKSEDIRDALKEYISSYEHLRFVPLWQLMHVMWEISSFETDTPIESMIMDLVDNFEKTILYELFIDVFDTFAGIECRSGKEFNESAKLFIKGGVTEAYLQDIGKYIYTEDKFPCIYVINFENPYQWRKSINAKANVELIVRYLNDRLEDDRIFMNISESLSPFFRYRDEYRYKNNCMSLYYTFFKQMLHTDEKVFTFTPLSRRTKLLITYCYYESYWNLDSYNFLKERHIYDMFTDVADMIIEERLYHPEELYLDPKIRNTKKDKLSQLMLRWLSYRRSADLFEYMKETHSDDKFFVLSLLMALNKYLSAPDYEYSQKSAAEHFLKISSREANPFQKADPQLCEEVHDLALSILEP